MMLRVIVCGSKVYVEVASPDGSVRVYTLNIQKAGSVDAKVIIIIIMILVILSGVIKYVQEKKKYKRKQCINYALFLYYIAYGIYYKT